MSFKKIIDRSDDELEADIERGVAECASLGSDRAFWTILTGIDAYFEKRRRKEESETNRVLTSAVAELQQAVLELSAKVSADAR